jgi:CxxC-x17-CxxC domain-containing protein
MRHRCVRRRTLENAPRCAPKPEENDTRRPSRRERNLVSEPNIVPDGDVTKPIDSETLPGFLNTQFHVVPEMASPPTANPRYADRALTCLDCGADFIFTADEQIFFRDKQFKNDPKRCKPCKAKRGNGATRVRRETQTTCAGCGIVTTVPFRPTQGRPVLCRSCFQKA